MNQYKTPDTKIGDKIQSSISENPNVIEYEICMWNEGFTVYLETWVKLVVKAVKFMSLREQDGIHGYPSRMQVGRDSIWVTLAYW